MIIDVREPFEFSSSHVKGAINIPINEIMKPSGAVNNLQKDGRYILYCQSGSRAMHAKSALERLGFKNVVNGINQEHVEVGYN